MTKLEALELFTRANGFLTPDRVLLGLQRRLDRRSVYSYLLRLKRQGLLETGPNIKRPDLTRRRASNVHKISGGISAHQRMI